MTIHSTETKSHRLNDDEKIWLSHDLRTVIMVLSTAVRMIETNDQDRSDLLSIIKLTHNRFDTFIKKLEP